MDDHFKQLLLLGREHYAKREYDKAEPLLRQVAKHTDRLADVFDMLGVIAHNRGDFTLARDWFERALVLNPSYTEAQLNLMVTLNDLGDYGEARKLYGQLKRRGGQQAAADAFVKNRIANMHAEISQAYNDVGMHVEAIQELEKAVMLCPSFPDLRTRLGVQYRDAGDRVRALEQFEKAKQDNPDYLQARLMLGVLHLSSGDHEGAEREFAAVLERDPGNTSARMYRRIARAQGGETTVNSSPPPKNEGG
jgi:tetratricopeptide (TPR) repeat protein